MTVKKVVPPPVPVAPSPAQYVWAAVAVVFVVGLLATVIVTSRPDADILIVLTVSFAFASSIITGIFSMIKSQETNAQSKETYLMVNSRLTQMMENATRADHAEGLEAGRQLANARTDKLAEDKKIDS